MDPDHKIICRCSELLFCLFLIAVALVCVPKSFASTIQQSTKKPAKILYINSYHPSFIWSETVKNQFESYFDSTQAEIKVVYMDSKRRNRVEDIVAAAEKVIRVANEFSPDIIVAADDNASKYVIEPNFKESKIPVVFVGVDIDEKIYGYPYSNATGIVEQPGLENLIIALKRTEQNIKNMGVILTNTTTAKKKIGYFSDRSVKVKVVDDFEQWKTAYLSLQSTMDIVLLDTYIGLKGYSDSQALEFIIHNTQTLIVSVSNPSKNLCHLCYLDIPKRHGHWVASTVKKILAGVSPNTIPIERSHFFKLRINKTLLQKTGIRIPHVLYELPHEEM